MESFKGNFLILLFFVAIAGAGYWSVISIQVDPEEFDNVSSDIRPIVVSGQDQVNSSIKENEVSQNNNQAQTPPTSNTNTSNNSFGDLKLEIQKLINDNVLMKKGSRGTRVGTVQEFLNIYNGTDSKKDNDFGGTTESQIKAFQKAEGLTPDGQTGPGTYKKMLEWLDKQN